MQLFHCNKVHDNFKEITFWKTERMGTDRLFKLIVTVCVTWRSTPPPASSPSDMSDAVRSVLQAALWASLATLAPRGRGLCIYHVWAGRVDDRKVHALYSAVPRSWSTWPVTTVLGRPLCWSQLSQLISTRVRYSNRSMVTTHAPFLLPN